MFAPTSFVPPVATFAAATIDVLEQDQAMLKRADLQVATLGERRIRSPLNLSTIAGDGIADYVPDGARVLVEIESNGGDVPDVSQSFEKAGPRETVFFDPAKTSAAIVTCGGLCPGLNNVIRSIVLQLFYGYGVRRILGYRYGYRGLNPASGWTPMPLDPDKVRNIHAMGGTLLGVSRGAESVASMVDRLVRDDIQILFTIGGDGTLNGAHAISEEVARRGGPISVVGVPKTIDNDIPFVDKTFGFDTAVEVARLALNGAHTEAVSAHNGIGLVKLMGRDAGFIAAFASLASVEVNFCLIPEVPFDMDGPQGLLASLEKRLADRGHALIVVAEGCAKLVMRDAQISRDASGNVRYADSDVDIGMFLKDTIQHHFKSRNIPVTLKYIDPSYMIRSVPANANDTVFCDILARHAVHAAMAGKTGIVIGRWHNVFTHVPLKLLSGQRKRIDPDSELWLAVTETTGQPDLCNTPLSRRPALWGRPLG